MQVTFSRIGLLRETIKFSWKAIRAKGKTAGAPHPSYLPRSVGYLQPILYKPPVPKGDGDISNSYITGMRAVIEGIIFSQDGHRPLV